MWHDPIARRVGTAAMAALAAVVLALCAAGRAHATEPTVATAGPEAAVYPELPNFHQVDSKLYRGGQPAAGGVERLKSLGIRSIVNLRYERGLVKAEEAEAAAAGLRYYNVPMYGLDRPTDDQVARIFRLIDDPANQPAFVHCKAGSDRTGAIVACYRIARARWSAEQAIREAFDYGMMRIEFAKRAFVRDFYARLHKGGAPPDGVGAVP